MNLFGIDLGGTKIEGVVIDSERPDQPRCRLRVPTGGSRGYEHVLGQLALLVTQLEEASGCHRPAIIGVGTPGTIEPGARLLKNSNTLCLNARPLREDLIEALGVEVRLANDANCFALAEATLGAARGHPVVMGLILGSGVGGGLVVNGQVLGGRHGIAGEWGHNPVEGEDAHCHCGHRGCLEAIISGPALERYYCGLSGRALRLPGIVIRADEGDADARTTLVRLRDKFARAIGELVNILDPDAIVIGGGVGNIDLLYGPETRSAILRHIFNPEFRTAILRPKLGDSAGVFGAAQLAAQS